VSENGNRPVWLALIAVVPGIIVGGVAPLLVAWQINANSIESRNANWARQDALAAVSVEKLDSIHDLVNSNMTAAIAAERNAHIATVTMMLEVIEMKRANGHEPNVKTLAALAVIEARIAELNATLADRAGQ